MRLGFLSKYLLEKTGVEAMYINDLDRRAVQCAMDNITDDRKLIIEGDGLEHLKKRKYDLIICNPPYIPRPRSIDDNPYEGVHVLHYLIHEGRKHLNAGGRTSRISPALRLMWCSAMRSAASATLSSIRWRFR